jgi:hypothetical protein
MTQSVTKVDCIASLAVAQSAWLGQGRDASLVPFFGRITPLQKKSQFFKLILLHIKKNTIFAVG